MKIYYKVNPSNTIPFKSHLARIIIHVAVVLLFFGSHAWGKQTKAYDISGAKADHTGVVSFNFEHLSVGGRNYTFNCFDESCAIGESWFDLTGIKSNSTRHNIKQNQTVSLDITVSPMDAICVGTSVTFTATPVNGGSNPQYQWFKNGIELEDETNNTYVTSSLANDDQIYAEIISNANPLLSGSQVTSNTITMTVYSMTLFTGGNQVYCSAGNYMLGDSPLVSGESSPYTIEWKRDGVFESDLANPIVTVNNTTTFTLEVTDANGCMANSQIQLNIENGLVLFQEDFTSATQTAVLNGTSATAEWIQYETNTSSGGSKKNRWHLAKANNSCSVNSSNSISIGQFTGNSLNPCNRNSENNAIIAYKPTGAFSTQNFNNLVVSFTYYVEGGDAINNNLQLMYTTNPNPNTTNLNDWILVESFFNQPDVTIAEINLPAGAMNQNTVIVGFLYKVQQGSTLFAGVDNIAVRGQASLSTSINSAICEGQTLNLSISGPNVGLYSWSGPEGYSASGMNTSIPNAQLNQAGLYSANLITTGGCSYQSNTSVIINANPTVDPGPANMFVCQETTSEIMAGYVGGGATGGTWSGGAGTWTNANDPGGATYNPTVDELGNITLTFTTNGGSCGVASASKIITVNPTSIINSNISEPTPTTCLSMPLAEISHSTYNVTNIASSSGLPVGVSAIFDPSTEVITIYGTPTTSGTYNYVITPEGCGAAIATGQIVVQAPEPIIIVEENSADDGDYIWNGLISNDWNEFANWYVKTGANTYTAATIAPTLSDNVFVVPNSIGGACVSNTNNPVVNVLALGSGISSDVIVHPLAQLTLSPNTTLEVSGNFKCYGAISFGIGSKLKFIGNDSTTLYIANPANNVIYNLEINKTNALVLLNDVHVSNEVLFNGGNIRLNYLTMDLGSTGFFTNENENSHAYCDCLNAKIVRIVNIQAGETIDAGNLGLSITPSVDMGTIRLERRHRRIVEPFNGMTESIARYYSVKDINGGSVQNNGELNATLVFNYLYAESNLNNSQLNLYHQANIDAYWYALGGYHDPSEKTVTYDKFQSFSLVTLGPSISGVPLPVTLTSFSANCDKEGVDIRWTTASEHNAAHFSLQNSRDGITWIEVTQLEAAGTTNQNTNYFYQDNNLSGLTYYRLVQTDFDGSFEIFTPISVNCEADETTMSVSPNPTAGEFVVTIQTIESYDNVQLEMVDLSGRIIQIKELNIVSGNNAVQFETKGIQIGTYIINIKGLNQKLEPIRIVVI